MIKKTVAGTYQVRLEYKENGKRVPINRTFKARKSAERFERDILTKKDSGNLHKDANLSVPDYFLQWFKTYRKSSLAPATVDRYMTSYNYLVKELANVPLSSMTRMKYQTFINKYADKPHSKASVTKLHNQIKASIFDAVEDGLIAKDFTQRIKIYGDEGVDPDTKFLEIKDTENLMDYLENTEDLYDISPAMIYTALFSGMRLSEVQGLTEEYFFPKFKRIQVARTLDRNLEFKPTKNKSSERIIDIPQNLVDYLERLIKLQHERNPQANPKKLIFMNKRGQVPSSNALKNALKKILHAINADKEITFHGLRHTHVSYLYAKGNSIEYISKRLGHKSVQTTIETYQHMMHETETNEIEKAIKSLERNTKVKNSQSS
ncbi:tyrosine-type recombinase/integrase [Jeotgalibaca porci]|uniref:tyrosine-type recombinase/integrase n=1 Tax=Jeotgalibaca porci TaxID=1868793 RepID=UPI0035A02C4D